MEGRKSEGKEYIVWGRGIGVVKRWGRYHGVEIKFTFRLMMQSSL
jgi:hypothetical protein